MNCVRREKESSSCSEASLTLIPSLFSRFQNAMAVMNATNSTHLMVSLYRPYSLTHSLARNSHLHASSNVQTSASRCSVDKLLPFYVYVFIYMEN